MSTAERDFYEILGVGRDADEAELKKAFRRRARELHPDVNPDDPGAEARFKELAEAYEVLSNAETRAAYDRFGREGLRGRPGPDMSGFGSFQDIFDAFFGGEAFGGRAGPRSVAGDDVLVGTQISFVESARGVEREVEVDLVEACPTCEGSGARAGGRVERCGQCGGQGQVRTVSRGPFGQFVRADICPTCAGDGEVILDRCATCVGRGRVSERRRVSVNLPAGIADGQRLRMTGRGHAGSRGAPPGDLYVEVRVKPDKRFLRDGLDVVSTVAVTVTDAMVGTTVTVPTVEGDHEIQLPAGTQPGQEIRLGGRGFPAINRRGRGDQRVVVEVKVPKVTTDEGREAVRKLADRLTDRHYKDDEGFFDRLKSAFK
jgi:molecular chaperone DnaJ